MGVGVPTHLRIHFPRCQLIGFDNLGIVRFTIGQRHIVEQRHVGASTSNIQKLEVLRQQRPHIGKAINGPFVQRNKVVPIRANGIAFGRRNVADVVMNGSFADQRPVGVIVQVGVGATQRPASDGAIEEEAGVGVAFVVKLGVQRPQPQLNLGFDDAIKVKHRYAIIVGFKVTGGNGVLNFLEAVDGHMGIELTGDNHVFAARSHVYPVGAFGFGSKVKEVFRNGRFQRNHREAIDIHRVARRRHLSRLV